MVTKKVLFTIMLMALTTFTAACAGTPTATPAPTSAGSQPSPTSSAIVAAPPPPTSSAIAVASPSPTDIPSYVAGVGRVISSSPTTVKLQGLHSGTDALWYWAQDGWLARADPTNGKEVATFQFDNVRQARYGNPKDMAVDGKTVWVTDAGQHAVARIDPNTNQIVERIALDKIEGVSNAVSAIGLALDGKTLWISDFDQNLVLKMDTESKQVVATIGNVKDPAGIATSPGAVWVVQHRSNSIVRIDPTTNKIVTTIDIPGRKEGTCGMCLGSLTGSQDAIWVPLYDGKGVARIDPKTNQIITIIPLPMVIADIAIGDGAIWAVGNLLGGPSCFLDIAGILARINPATNTVVGTIAIPCAHSVVVAKGDVWVGTWGSFKTGTLYRIKPDP